MLGWMIKRGLDGGRDATDEPDDTQIEQPDTPGPVFAARAFKSAIFGTPARPDSNTGDKQLGAEQKTDGLEATSNARDVRERATPGRLPGILLTPGTATSRRKRVSFGHNVEYDESKEPKPEFKIDANGSKRSLFGDNEKNSRTTLAQALENSRNQNNKAAAEEKKKQAAAGLDTTADKAGNAAEDDNAWEEVDDNDNDTGDWDPDVTVDLNEPHSQSGRYWKSQFQRYQEDAKVEMSKLLKYKQLAKSYAKMKDTEAGDMHAKLKEEKDKVAQMEARITELAGQLARKRMKGTNRDYQEHISDLTRQTALAVQYRNQVKELEAMLQDTDADDVFRTGDGSETPSGVSGRRRSQSAFTSAASPRTQKTLLDTQRELRRARDQAKDLAQAKDEVRRLKTALRAAEQKAISSENESKSLAADLASSEAASEASASKVHDLEKRAKFAEDERRRKDDELRLLQRKYDSLKEDAKARVAEAEQVLRRKNEQIANLRRQLQQGSTTNRRMDGAAAEENLMDLDADVAPVQATSKVDKPTIAAKSTAAAPTTLAALEKVTRSRYESLANRRSLEQKTAPPPTQQSSAGGIEGLIIDINDLDFNDADEPQLPQQKLGGKHRSRQHQKDEPVVILEDETSHFELPPIKSLAGKGAVTTTARSALGSLGARSRLHDTTRRKKTESDDEGASDQDAVAAANLILLRRRRAAEPLRPTESRHKGLAESAGLNSKAPLAGARKRTAPSAAVVHYARAQGTEAHADPVTTAAAAAADASNLSISSARAAAAVARIEKRRAQRQRELGLQQNKENLQPA